MTPSHLSISSLWFAICSLAFSVDNPFLGFSALAFGTLWLLSKAIDDRLTKYFQRKAKIRGR